MDTSRLGIKRRRWTIEEKQRIVLETLEPGTSVPRVAQKYALNANLVFTWRRQYREGRPIDGEVKKKYFSHFFWGRGFSCFQPHVIKLEVFGSSVRIVPVNAGRPRFRFSFRRVLMVP